MCVILNDLRNERGVCNTFMDIITVRIPDAVLKALDELARFYGLTRSDLIRRSLEEYVAQKKAP